MDENKHGGTESTEDHGEYLSLFFELNEIWLLCCYFETSYKYAHLFFIFSPLVT
jgi:hypothetical protein